MIVVDTSIISYLFIKGERTEAVKKYCINTLIGFHLFYGVVNSEVCYHYT